MSQNKELVKDTWMVASKTGDLLRKDTPQEEALQSRATSGEDGAVVSFLRLLSSFT